MIASKELETFAKRLSNDKWPEYFDGKQGRIIGKEAIELQLWTIAGYIVAYHLLKEP